MRLQVVVTGVATGAASRAATGLAAMAALGYSVGKTCFFKLSIANSWLNF